MEKDLRKILNIAIWAPSGDNCQPWKFSIDSNKVYVMIDPEKDTSVYNFKNYASMIALGALLENIKATAAHFGYALDMQIKENFDDNVVALCIFEKTTKEKENELFNFIKKRQTNRKPYEKKKIDLSAMQELMNCSPYPGLHLHIVDNENDIKELGALCSINERVVLENKQLHDFLFGHITWTEKEDQEKKGFYIKTLELKGPQRIAFGLLKSWRINNLLNKIGISKLVAKDNAKLYSCSAAILAITANSINQKSFLYVGAFMQKLWLLGTKHNIYMQPLTGLIFLNHRLREEGNLGNFTNLHQQMIKNAYQKVIQIVKTEEPVMILLRIGYAEQPTAGTKRREAKIEIKNGII